MTNETREPVYVGIDVSKDSLEVALADKAASVRFVNDEQGVKALLEHLAGHNVAVVLLEATGGPKTDSPLASMGAVITRRGAVLSLQASTSAPSLSSLSRLSLASRTLRVRC